MKFTIRPATEEDAVIVSSILIEAAQWLTSVGMSMWRIEEVTLKEARKEIGDFLIAEDFTKAVAGVAKMQTEDAEFWPDVPRGESVFLHRLAVRRAFAGRGVSKELLDFVVRRAGLLGKQFVRLDCAVDRPKLRAVYENYGFRHHSNRVVGPFHVARYQYELGKQLNQALPT